MEIYVLKVYDRRLIQNSEVELYGLDQVIGALNFVSCHPDFKFDSVKIVEVE